MQAPHLPLAAAAAGHLPSIPLAPHPAAGLSGSGPAALMGRLAGSAHLHNLKEEKGLGKLVFLLGCFN